MLFVNLSRRGRSLCLPCGGGQPQGGVTTGGYPYRFDNITHFLSATWYEWLVMRNRNACQFSPATCHIPDFLILSISGLNRQNVVIAQSHSPQSCGYFFQLGGESCFRKWWVRKTRPTLRFYLPLVTCHSSLHFYYSLQFGSSSRVITRSWL